MHEGHRQRMLERLEGEAHGLQDHELLEILLFFAIPRRNTNGIAHELLSSFGSLAGVFNATKEELEQVNGVGESTAAYLRGIGLIFKRVNETGMTVRPSAFNYEEFSRFVSGRFSGLDCEVLELYALDANSRIKSSKRFSSNDSDSVCFDPGEITRFIVAAQPTKIVVAHNHLKGTCLPSAQDDYFTEQVQLICSLHNIRLAEHLIVSPEGQYSYYKTGKLAQICERYDVAALLKRI